MEEAEGQPGEEAEHPEHAALQERWRQQRLADQAQMLYHDSEEEEDDEMRSGSSGDDDDGRSGATLAVDC